MNKKWIAIGAVVIVIIAIAIALSLNNASSGSGNGAAVTTVTGEAQGFGGTITARVTLSGDRITGLEIDGPNETAGIGDRAIASLTDSILAAGTVEGIQAVSSATVTSNGVLTAVRNAITGTASAPAASSARVVDRSAEIQAAAVTHGLGIHSLGRLGPGSDDTGTGVYSYNVVIAYTLFDNAGRILDMEVDQLEIATPNYDGSSMPDFTGFPGQSYNADTNHDGTVDRVNEQTYDSFLAEVDSWRTKRERGSAYRMTTGTWSGQMDIFQEAFKGMTVDEVEQWFAAYCSDVNGRPLSASSSNAADVAKYNALSAEGRAALDAVSGATMSLNDPHGNIIAAIVKSYENRVPVNNATRITKIGIGVTSSGTIAYGTDSLGESVYNLNMQISAASFNDDGSIAGLYTDVLQVVTPNSRGPVFTGFPGQSYSGGDAILEQTEDTFLAQIEGWVTKRERGSTYVMPSGTWAQQMDVFQNFFEGNTMDEASAWYAACFSDIDGKVLFGNSENEADIAKYNALSASERAAVDALTGASMSIRNNQGDIMGSIEKTWDLARDTNIVVSR